MTFYLPSFSVEFYAHGTHHVVALADYLLGLVGEEAQGIVLLKELCLEGLVNFVGGKFTRLGIGFLVNQYADLRVHGLGEFEAKFT